MSNNLDECLAVIPLSRGLEGFGGPLQLQREETVPISEGWGDWAAHQLCHPCQPVPLVSVGAYRGKKNALGPYRRPVPKVLGES